MKNLIFVLGFLISVRSFAEETTPIHAFQDYSKIKCLVAAEDGEELGKFEEKLIVVKMGDHVGLFKQMRLQVGLDQIQLQVLLEENSAAGGTGSVNYLLNLAVNDKEISSEFSGLNIHKVAIKNQTYKAHCEVL